MSLNIVTEIDNRVAVKHVLMSVSDKTGLETFVPALVKACPGVKIYSTGGTYTKVKEILGDKAEGTLVAVSDYTGQPEMQGGLVKTLDFKIYLGILSETYNDAHQADIKRLDAVALDMVVVNLYPFKQTVAKEGVTPEMARTNIDIGGPCMVRASAKNYLRETDLRLELIDLLASGKATFPVKVFQSERDGIVRPENATFLKAVFPQAEVTMVPGSEHALPVEIPEEIDAAVAELLG